MPSPASDQARWAVFSNTETSEAVPAWGIVKITDTTSSVLQGEKPDSGTGVAYYPNDYKSISAGANGRCATSFPAWVKYVGSAPTVGDIWGPVSGSWGIESGGTGWKITGVDSEKGICLVRPIESSSQKKRGILEGSLSNLSTATARVTVWDKGRDLSTSSGTVTAGTFYFTLDGEDSSNLDWDSTAAEIQTELEAFDALTSDNTYVYGGDLPSTAVTITITTSVSLSITTSLTGGDFALTDKTDEWTKSATTETVRDIMGICGSLPIDAVVVFETVDTCENAVTAANCSCNEIQQIQITGTPTAGTFVLDFDSQTTAAIDYDATAADIEDELEALSSIGTGNVRVTGGDIDSEPVLVEFIGSLGGADQDEITVDTDSVTGGTVVVSTVVDGG